MRATTLLAAFLFPALMMAQAIRVSSNPSSLKTHRDARTGVSFQYPAVWKIADSTKTLPPFDYCPPAAFAYGKPSNPANGIPIRFAVQFTGDGNVYAHTDLNSLVFMFGWRSHMTEEACRNVVATSAPSTGDKVVIHGVPFTHTSGGECGLSHGVSAEIYSAFRAGTCLVFEEDFYTVHADTRELTPAEQRALQRHLDAIMQSVRLAAKP